MVDKPNLVAKGSLSEDGWAGMGGKHECIAYNVNQRRVLFVMAESSGIKRVGVLLLLLYERHWHIVDRIQY